jgi:transposase
VLTPGEDAEARSLRGQGWTITAIARHLGRSRRTVGDYLHGRRVAGLRRPPPDAVLPYLDHCARRRADDPALPASTLYDEITLRGYRGGYSTLTRALRRQHQPPPHQAEPGERADRG